MPSKNKLTSLKRVTKNSILPSLNDANTNVISGRAGRKPKPKDEKQTNKVTLSFDKNEWIKLEEKAGLAGKATVIHEHLKNTGFFK